MEYLFYYIGNSVFIVVYPQSMVHCLIDVKNPTVKEKLLAAEMMLYLHQDFSRDGRNSTQEQVRKWPLVITISHPALYLISLP